MTGAGDGVLQGVGISGVCTVLPAGGIDFVQEMTSLGVPLPEVEKAARLSGLSRRRIAPPDVTAVDLCTRAAQELLVALGEGRPDPDVVLFVSQSPDYPLPASACIVQGRLGLRRSCMCLDMNGGCAGYVNGLLTGMSLLAGGGARSVLLLVGDTQGRFLDPENRVTAPLFGDAGTATLLERREADVAASFAWGTDGSGSEALTIPGGGSRIPVVQGEAGDAPFNAVVRDAKGNPWTLGDYGQLWMDGVAVFGFGVTTVPRHVKAHCAKAGIEPGSLEMLVLHQANRMMMETIANKAGVPLGRVPMETLSRYGNLGAASIPAVLCDEFGGRRTPQGDVMLCGFGAGLAWASCILSLKGTLCLPPVTWDGQGLSREEAMARWHERFREAR
ncbi:MAG: ketoacyl-ACP synthase III [Desulfovibrio sp.]|nr:ketoacyl-ACP synthase III [Desulfovibrio sp.]